MIVDGCRKVSTCVVLLSCACWVTIVCNYLDNEIEDFNDMKPKDVSNGIHVSLGIPDVQATVGKYFAFKIPDNAFSGATSYVYEIYQSADREKKLPSWLYYDPETSTLHGVPQANNLGATKLTVVATDPNLKNNQGQTTFAIGVDTESRNDNSIPSDGIGTGGLSKIVRCDIGEPLTYVSVKMDANLNELPSKDVVEFISRVSQHFSLPRELLRLLSLDEGDSVFDGSSVIIGGPGNVRKKRYAESAVLRWKVGCSGSVNYQHQPLIERLEIGAQDGTLANVIGLPVIGWLVSQNDQSNRIKRRAEPINDSPIEDVEPDVRIVPTMASPTFDGMKTIDPTEKHHHRTKTKGRHQHTKSIVHHRITDPSDLYFGGTPLPTPMLVPSRPTDMSISTVVDERTRPIITEMTASVTPTLPPVIQPTPTFTDASKISPTRPSHIPEKTKSVKNFKPTVINRLKKLFMTDGKVFSYRIPSNTFSDFEEGNTRNLQLHLRTTEDKAVLPKNSWIHLDPVKQLIYALPLEENIGTYNFILEGCDGENICVDDTLTVKVWQHPKSRSFSHQFMAQMKYSSWKFPLQVDLRKLFVGKVARFFGDADAENIAIRKIESNPLKIFWANDSLTSYPCPKSRLDWSYDRLSSKRKPNHPSKRFRDAMRGGFEITRVGVEFMGVCADDSTDPIKPPSLKPGSNASSTKNNTGFNTKPEKTNPIDYVNATEGEILVFRVPDDTFYDVEDTPSRRLKLMLLDLNGATLSKASWLQFDSINKQIYGLPFNDNIGQESYQMVAEDTGGLTARDSFIVEVHPRPRHKLNIEFSLHLDHDYQSFRNDVSKQVALSWRLAKFMGDPNPSKMSILSITKGSVVFAWTNRSLPYDPCPKEEINEMVQKILGDNGSFSQELVDALKPEFRILKAEAMPQGICLGILTPTFVEVPKPVDPKETEHATSNDDIYITTIIPAVIIAAMLIIAAIVACILYRKRRKGKMTTQDNSTFITKGIPIIFADEIDDNKGQSANSKGKSPALLRDERPPLPPPEYNRSASAPGDRSDSEGADSPLLSRREQPTPHRSRSRNEAEDPLFNSSAPSYEPPPPFTTNSNSRQARPKPTPTYRNPPPYVPP